MCSAFTLLDGIVIILKPKITYAWSRHLVDMGQEVYTAMFSVGLLNI